MTALWIDHKALDHLTESGSSALPRETGGLLLGHFANDEPIVTLAPTILDRRATRIRYRRDAPAAASTLGHHIAADESGLLGYLGEWHTHPLPIGPSATDVHASGRLAHAGGHDIALLVLALGSRGWSGHALNADPKGNVEPIKFNVGGSDNDG